MSDTFYCCINEALIKKNKNGYICPKCGKFYANQSILFHNQIIEFKEGRKKSLYKLKARKVSKTFSGNEIITLQTGKVSLYSLSEKDIPLFIKEYEVKKSSLKLRVHESNTFLTITDNGIVDVYNKNTGILMGSKKIKSKFSNYCVIPSETDGKWILVTAPGIYLCDETFSHEQEIVNLFEELDCYEFNIKKIKSNGELNQYVFYVRYLTNGKDNYFKYAFVTLDMKGEEISYTITKSQKNNCIYTYKISENKYYALEENILYEIHNDIPKKICELPVVMKLLDGNVLQHPEQFMSFPTMLYIIKNSLIALTYDTELIIFNTFKQEIIESFSFDSNLIQSFLVFDNRIIFSAGSNTYMYYLE